MPEKPLRTPVLALSLLLLTLALSLPVLSSPASAVEIGAQAPAITPQELVSGGEGAFDPSVLEGKAVVLEFWATWCGPCVSEIPHWNELVAEFANENIVFLSISDESERTLRRFLKERPISGLVAVDGDRSTFDAYDVGGIPRTFLIDAQGRVQADTHPALLQSEHIRALLAGQKPDVGRVALGGMSIEEMAEASETEPIFRTVIRPAAQSDTSMMSGGHGRLWILNMPVTMALQHAYDVGPARLVLDAQLTSDKYDFLFDVGEEHDAAPFVRAAVEHTFGLTSSVETRELDVLVLRTLPGAEDKLTPGTPGGRTSVRPGYVQGANLPLAGLAGMLESLLRKVVLDETDLEGRFAIDLSWDEKSFESLNEVLREEYALELIEERREVEVTVVQSKAETAEAE